MPADVTSPMSDEAVNDLFDESGVHSHTGLRSVALAVVAKERARIRDSLRMSGSVWQSVADFDRACAAVDAAARESGR